MADSRNIYSFKSSKSGNEETHYFLTRGRISRNSFFNRSLLVLFCYLILVMLQYFYWKPLVVQPFQNDNTFISNYIIWYKIYHYLIPFFFVLFILIQSAKRVHDINRSAFNLLVPFMNVYYLLLPGTKGKNDFGIDPISERNIKYFDEMGSNKSHSSSKKGFELIKLPLIIFLLASSIYFSFDNVGIGSISSIRNKIPDDINISLNIKNRNQVNIGFVSVSSLDKQINDCLSETFLHRNFKYIQKDDASKLLEGIRENKIDLLLLSKDEAKKLLGVLDQTNSFYVRSISTSATLLLPHNNNKILNDLNDCIAEFINSK